MECAVPHCAWSRVPWSLESGLGLRRGGPRPAPGNSSCFWWTRPPPLLAVIAGHPSGWGLARGPRVLVPMSSPRLRTEARGVQMARSGWGGTWAGFRVGLSSLPTGGCLISLLGSPPLSLSSSVPNNSCSPQELLGPWGVAVVVQLQACPPVADGLLLDPSPGMSSPRATAKLFTPHPSQVSPIPSGTGAIVSLGQRRERS